MAVELLALLKPTRLLHRVRPVDRTTRLEVDMKVLGTGSPQVAFVRFEACEVETVRAELARLHAELSVSDEQALECRAVESMIDCASVAIPGAILELEGPFDLLRDLVWTGLRPVCAALQDAVESARVGRVQGALEAATTVHAWVQTVADLDRVENRGVQELAAAGSWDVDL
jgi:hypothetical protein